MKKNLLQIFRSTFTAKVVHQDSVLTSRSKKKFPVNDYRQKYIRELHTFSFYDAVCRQETPLTPAYHALQCCDGAGTDVVPAPLL